MDNKFPILGSNPKEYIKSDLIKPHEKVSRTWRT